MTLTAHLLAAGPHWQAEDVRCCAGPDSPVFEEAHDRICMAIVLSGTFEYRSTRGRAALAPGALLLGNPGDHYECRHTHSVGDRCLSFHFDVTTYEELLSDIEGATGPLLPEPALPPARERTHLLAAADSALEDEAAAEELMLLVAGAVAQSGAGRPSAWQGSSAVAARVHALAHWIEDEPDHPHSLDELASLANVSPYHLLREFKRELGVTPYQFVLSLRLRRAAHLLRTEQLPVLEAALTAGFADLSEFNRRFRREMGRTPSQYRSLLVNARAKRFSRS